MLFAMRSAAIAWGRNGRRRRSVLLFVFANRLQLGTALAFTTDNAIGGGADGGGSGFGGGMMTVMVMASWFWHIHEGSEIISKLLIILGKQLQCKYIKAIWIGTLTAMRTPSAPFRAEGFRSIFDSLQWLFHQIRSASKSEFCVDFNTLIHQIHPTSHAPWSAIRPSLMMKYFSWNP